MVQKDPGGVEAQIPEPPRCRRAVTARSPALAARTHAPAQLTAIRDASRPPASHLKGNADSGTLQLFHLKEKKKKIPNHTKNKTNSEQEFRVALLALCALWRPPRTLLAARVQRCARLPDSHLDQWDWWHQLSTVHPGHLLVPLWPKGQGVSLGSFLPPRLSRNSSPGVVRASAGVASDLGGWECSWLLSVCSFPHVPSSRPVPCAVGPVFSSCSSSGCRIPGVFLSECSTCCDCQAGFL